MVRTFMMILDFHVAKNLKIVNRGCSVSGQLGHGNYQLTPRKVEALADEVIVDVACGVWPVTGD